MKKEKKYKCTYCKEFVEPDQLIEWVSGGNNPKKVRAHKDCRKIRTDRKEFYDWLLELLDVPSVDKYTVMALDNLYKSGYNWEVIKHATMTKLKVIQENFSKGLAYMCGIIRNQCPVSYKLIEQEEQLLKQQEIIKKQIAEKKTNVEINVGTRKHSSKSLYEEDDFSKL